MRSRTLMCSIAAGAAVVALATGCGGDEKSEQAVVQEGAVHYRDALDDNSGGWLTVDDVVYFRDGHYVWNQIPAGLGGAANSDAQLKKKVPEGVSISVDAEMRDGAALRTVTCREHGTDDFADDWYELGIDGRRALIRRMQKSGPPKVLASADAPIENGRSVRITGQCIPNGDGDLVLALKLDGKEVARAKDSDPLPASRDGKAGTLGIHAYQRPDTPGAANMTWDDFEVRSATLKAS